MSCGSLFAANDTTNLYLFIDESGDLNFSASGSPFYFFTALWTYDPACLASDIQGLRYNLLHRGREVSQFHACQDSRFNEVLVALYDVIEQHQCIKLASIIIQKNKTNMVLQPAGRFYPRMLDIILKFALKGEMSRGYDRALVITDRAPKPWVGKAVKEAVAQTIPTYLATGANHNFYAHPSMSDPCLQAVDYCCWALQRHRLRGESVYYNQTAHLYDKTPLDVFARGNTTYY